MPEMRGTITTPAQVLEDLSVNIGFLPDGRLQPVVIHATKPELVKIAMGFKPGDYVGMIGDFTGNPNRPLEMGSYHAVRPLVPEPVVIQTSGPDPSSGWEKFLLPKAHTHATT